MSKKALLPTLSAFPFATVLCARRSGDEQMPISSHNLPPSLGDTSGGPHGVEGTRKARGSEGSVSLGVGNCIEPVGVR
jgi:hypothetical protein